MMTFAEPGGDASFVLDLVGSLDNFWNPFSGSPVLATDFVHGGHQKSIGYPLNTNSMQAPSGCCADAGSRISFYLYLNALPSGNSRILRLLTNASGSLFSLRLTSGGVLQLLNDSGSQMGSNGAALSAGVWYRICVAYTISSTTVNEFRVFKDGSLTITTSNQTQGTIGTDNFQLGNISGDGSMDLRTSDHYVDNSAALTDPGDVWVTAKRPNANGSVNGFTTQIGSGGSGYGSGHSPQVNERPLGTTNGWSMVGVGSAVTEEYSIEGVSTGDINIGSGTIIDFIGWLYAKSLVAETGQIIVAGSASNISLNNNTKLFTKYAGSSTYPAGNTDIGIITATNLTTVSLYECGVIVAFILSPNNNYTKNLAETVSLTDTLKHDVVRLLSETVSLTDIIGTIRGKALTLTESFNLIDTVQKFLNGGAAYWRDLLKNISAWVDGTKHSSSFTDQNKNNSSWNDQTKN